MNLPNGATPTPPQGIPPQPLPTMLMVTQTPDGRGGTSVVLQVSTPAGVGVYFLDPDTALATADNLRNAGLAAKTGIVVAGPGAIPPLERP